MGHLSFSTWLNEGMGAEEYRPPEDARQLMYDFYLLNMIQTNPKDHNSDRERDLIWNARHAYETLVPHLRSHILEKVANSLLSEIRHYPNGKNIRDNEFYEDLKAAFYNRNSGDFNPDEFAPLAREMADLFLHRGWRSSYGGQPWSYACKAWMKLYQARSIKDMSVWIDHIYDLQHNTGSLLNKNREYRGSWVDNALEMKKHATDIDDFLDGVSPWVRNLGRRFIHMTQRRGADGNQSPLKRVDGPEDFDQQWIGRQGNQQQRAKRLEMEYNRLFKHSSVYVEDYEHDEGDYIYWSGYTSVSFPLSQFQGAAKDIGDLSLDSLKKVLDDHHYYLGHYASDSINLDYHGDKVQFNFDLSQASDNQSGDVDDFRSFCDEVHDWDKKNRDLKEIIAEFLMSNGFMPLTPSREYLSSLDHEGKSPWQYFDWEGEKGSITATASETIGVSRYLSVNYGLTTKVDDKQFLHGINRSIQAIVGREINQANQAITRQMVFPGFDPPKKVLQPRWDRLSIWIDPVRDERPGHDDRGGYVMRLNISLGLDDKSDKRQVEEFKVLITYIDRLFPKITSEASRLLAAYDQHYNQEYQKRGWNIPQRTATGMLSRPMPVALHPSWMQQQPPEISTKIPLQTRERV